MFSHNLEMAAFVNALEHDREVARCERMRKLGLFDNKPPRGPSARTWVAERLLALALRLDRHAGERVDEEMRLRTA